MQATHALRSERGQTATEYMLIVSVVVIAVVAAAFTFVPTFRDGVSELAKDVASILSTGQIGGVGQPRNDGMNATASNHSQRCTDQAKDPRYAAMFDPPKCIEDPAPEILPPAPPGPTLAERIDKAIRDAHTPRLPAPVPAHEDPAIPTERAIVARRARFARRPLEVPDRGRFRG